MMFKRCRATILSLKPKVIIFEKEVEPSTVRFTYELYDM